MKPANLLLAGAAVLFSTALVVAQGQPKRVRPDSGHPRVTTTVKNVAESASNPSSPFPNQGKHPKAKNYYDDIAVEIGIGAAAFSQWTPAHVTSFMGYPQLGMTSGPCDLMGLAKDPDDILAMRYFSPKISSVDANGKASEIGWRQIVRLKTRSGSRADQAGIAAAFVLLNYQQPLAGITQDPFAGIPFYTQVMLIARPGGQLRPGYWVLFDERGERSPAITATFDGGDAARSAKQLFVPDACAQCHGGDEALPHLNILDIDQWYDRALPGDDFAEVTTRSPVGIAVTGSCTATPMVVTRKLNAEIQRFNETPAVDAPEFVKNAGAAWLAQHPTDAAKILSASERGFGKGPVWDPAKASDVELLNMLNRYCYRCHANILFNVFDRSSMVEWKEFAVEQLNLGRMPFDRQGDRKLPDSERTRLLKLFDELK